MLIQPQCPIVELLKLSPTTEPIAACIRENLKLRTEVEIGLMTTEPKHQLGA